jgi:putative tricarboxylic transport membrane protein
MPYKAKVTATQAGATSADLRLGRPAVDYQMLRGIFMPPGVTPEQVKFYTDLFGKVRALPEWKDFMEKGAFNQTTMSGQEFFDWLGPHRAAAPRADARSRLPGQ